MYLSDWQRLGLSSPTHDLPTIKRAYALRLRSARPDDDAQAYQALREAYERAQHWARQAATDVNEAVVQPDWLAAANSQHDDAAPADTTASAPAPALAEEPMRAAPNTLNDETNSEAPATDIDTPEALAQRCVDGWLEHGDEALLREWAHIEAALIRLPLSQRAEASARFADLVISCPNVPVDFLRGLQDHFGWLGDFRTDRIIGPARAEALRQALADVVVLPISDPQVLRQHAGLLQLARLSKRRIPLQSWLYAALIGWPLRWQLNRASPRLLSGLGIDVLDRRKINAVLKMALWLRLAAVAAMVFAIGLATSGGDAALVAAKFPVIVLLGSIAFGVTLVTGARVSDSLGRARANEALACSLAGWRASRWGPWSGVLALALSVGLFALALDDPEPIWLWFGGAALALLGAIPCWPARTDLGVVAAGVWGFLLAGLLFAAPREGLAGVLFGIAGLCTVLGVWVAEGRLRARLPRYTYAALFIGFNAARHLTNFKFADSFMGLGAVAVVALVASPLTMTRVDREGLRFALTPMLMAGAALSTLERSADGPGLLVAWIVSLALLLALQRAATWLAHRWFGSESPAPR